MNTREKATRISDPLEHRFGRRIPLEVPVTLVLDGRPLGHGLLRDASISGALIETALELPVFANLTVVLPMTGEAGAGPHELAACVVRCETARVAVEWRDMQCAAIVALLKKISGGHAESLRVDEAFTSATAGCAFVSS